MKKLITTCCVAVAMMLPMTVTVHAEPYDHPEIRQAIHALENARLHLQEAKHDFGGHRKAALDAVDEAIAQLKIALKYD